MILLSGGGFGTKDRRATYPRNLTRFFAPRPPAPFCALCPSLKRHTPTRTPLRHTPHSRHTKDRVRGFWSIFRQEPLTQSNAGSKASHIASLLLPPLCQINTHTAQPTQDAAPGPSACGARRPDDSDCRADLYAHGVPEPTLFQPRGELAKGI